jgi:hypothetical protein
MNYSINTDRFTPGNPKRKRPWDQEWFKRISLKAYTDTEWMQRFKTELTPKEQFDFIRSFIPKEVKVDSNSTFQLIINGLQNKVIDSKVIEHAALDEHEEDD